MKVFTTKKLANHFRFDEDVNIEESEHLVAKLGNTTRTPFGDAKTLNGGLTAAGAGKQKEKNGQTKEV